MTSQNDRVVRCHLRVSAFDLYFTRANEGCHRLCVCVCGFVVWWVGGRWVDGYEHSVQPSNNSNKPI